MIIDTHCHLSLDDYDTQAEIDNAIKNAADNIIIMAGVCDKTNRTVIEYVNKYPNIYGMLGLHPEMIDTVTSESFEYIKENLSNPKIVGVGEIGLDYNFCVDNKEEQKALFIKQIDIAKQYNKPITVHSRDAYTDTYNILKEYKGKDMKIVMHCFSYSLECACELMKLGLKFGIGGILTFKNNRKLLSVVEELDISNFVLETDSPYLAPEPVRGTKNEPANVKYIAEKLASIKGITYEEVCKITSLTAIKEFDLDVKIC